MRLVRSVYNLGQNLLRQTRKSRFFHITTNSFKRSVLPRSPLTMLSICDLTLHSGPKTTLKGGRGGVGAQI